MSQYSSELECISFGVHPVVLELVLVEKDEKRIPKKANIAVVKLLGSKS